MPASLPASVSDFILIFDCRVDSGGEAQWEVLRDAVYTQCTRLLRLAHTRVNSNGARCDVRLFCMQHSGAVSALAQGSVPQDIRAAAAAALERLRTATPDASGGRTDTGLVRQPLSRMEDASVPLQSAVLLATRKRLVLFCTSYVDFEDVTAGIYGLDVQHYTEVRCVVVDTRAACVTMGLPGPGRRVYRSPWSAADLQSVLQACLVPFLLPGLPLRHSLRLLIGSVIVPVTAMLPYFDAALVAEEGTSATAEPAPRQPSLPAGGAARWVRRPAAGQASAAGATPYASGARVPRPLPPSDDDVAGSRANSPILTLALGAVAPPSCLDEACLCGDTWVVEFDIAGRGPMTESEAATFWHELLGTFRKDALIFTGHGEDVGRAFGGPATHEHHHFVAYVEPFFSMRLRRVVPSELRCGPLTCSDTRFEVEAPSRYAAALTMIRTQLEERTASSSFSLDDFLRGQPRTPL